LAIIAFVFWYNIAQVDRQNINVQARADAKAAGVSRPVPFICLRRPIPVALQSRAACRPLAAHHPDRSARGGLLAGALGYLSGAIVDDAIRLTAERTFDDLSPDDQQAPASCFFGW
jgi:hypothetical protein